VQRRQPRRRPKGRTAPPSTWRETPELTNDAHLSVAALERCVTAISQWMSANRLKLNMEKTEWLWTGTRSNLDRLPKSTLQLVLGNDTIDVADAVRFLGVLISPDLCFDKHVTAVSAKCFFQLHQLH